MADNWEKTFIADMRSARVLIEVCTVCHEEDCGGRQPLCFGGTTTKINYSALSPEAADKIKDIFERRSLPYMNSTRSRSAST